MRRAVQCTGRVTLGGDAEVCSHCVARLQQCRALGGHLRPLLAHRGCLSGLRHHRGTAGLGAHEVPDLQEEEVLDRQEEMVSGAP